MARLSLNKSALTRQMRLLAIYRQYLPSLDLKRRQLLQEQQSSRVRLASLTATLEPLLPELAERVPMLALSEVPLDGLVQVAGVRWGEENLVGVHLPVLQDIDWNLQTYSLFALPHWVDEVARGLRQVLELRLRMHVAQRRVQLLDDAVRIITQRVNLFEKVLIPRTRENIRRIHIRLSDEERAGVVRAKIAKAKRGQSS